MVHMLISSSLYGPALKLSKRESAGVRHASTAGRRVPVTRVSGIVRSR